MCYNDYHMSSSPTSLSKKSGEQIALIAAVVAGIAILLVIIMMNFQKPIGNVFKTYGQGYIDGYNAARKQAMELGPSPIPDRVHTLSGKVTGVSGNYITFTASGLSLDPQGDRVPEVRTVEVNSHTRIERQHRPTPEEMKSDLERLGEGGPMDDSSVTRNEKVEVGDIKEGDFIVVTSVDQQDILSASSFVGGTIIVSSEGAPSARVGAPYANEEPVEHAINLREASRNEEPVDEDSPTNLRQ